ncbi:MAG: hypothetical protein ACOYOK_15190 [Pseudobdellovibrionaceae bacterium]
MKQKINFIISICLLCSLVSCGPSQPTSSGDDGSNKTSTNNPSSGNEGQGGAPGGDPNQKPNAYISGYVGRCVMAVSEDRAELTYLVNCSEIMTANNYDTLARMLADWSNKNCRKVIPILNSSSQFNNCKLRVNPTVMPMSQYSLAYQDGDCPAKKGLSYGKVFCN